MTGAPVFREATRADVPAVVDLLADDILGQTRERAGMDQYLAAFDSMKAEGNNRLVVAEQDGRVVACYQLIVMSGLSLSATRRAEIEGVRVAADRRGRGLGGRGGDRRGRRGGRDARPRRRA